jgi:hypothetical protein
MESILLGWQYLQEAFLVFGLGKTLLIGVFARNKTNDEAQSYV